MALVCEAGSAARRDRAVLPFPGQPGARRGGVHRRRRPAGPGHRHAAARAPRGDRAGARHHHVRGGGPRRQPAHARRVPQLRLRDDGAADATSGVGEGRADARADAPSTSGGRPSARSGRRRLRWQRLFEPRSVAVVGASRTRGKIGAEIVHNLVATGLPRAGLSRSIRSARTIEGVQRVRAPRGRSGAGRPRRHRRSGRRRSPAVVDECVAKGVHGDRRDHRGLLRDGPGGARARGAPRRQDPARPGIRMVGPNCMGLLNTEPGRAPERHVRARLSAGGQRRAVLAERRARPRPARLRLAAEPRASRRSSRSATRPTSPATT